MRRWVERALAPLRRGVLKHSIKRRLRAVYSRAVFHSGLHILIDRLMPRRHLILAGHCVERNGELPACLSQDMRIGAERLKRMLAWFVRRYEVCTLDRGQMLLQQERGGRSLVSLTMDDGYRDNRATLLPILASLGKGATIFVETQPLDERRVNWTHKFFWIHARLGSSGFLAAYERERGEPAPEDVRRSASEDSSFLYRFKRYLKYEADPELRDRVIESIFLAQGGGERELCDQLYMSWDDVRALRDAGCEIGCHTHTHAILSRLAPDDQRAEIEKSHSSMVCALGAPPRSFAYPFGRNWDYDARTVDCTERLGFHSAVTTHAGVNLRGCDPMRLRRVMIDDGSQLHLLATEACGGFELLRRLGMDLSE